MSEILVLYYSRHGAVRKLADYVCRGIEKSSCCSARLRTVPDISTVCEQVQDAIPEHGAIYAEAADLAECSGLIIGSPCHFGNMAAPLKYFLDSTTPQWLAGALSGKPAGVFTSSSSMHGGQESTLLSMMLPLLHHGMLISGIPYSEAELSATQSGGSPYGATHVAGSQNDQAFSDDEKKLAAALGYRIARISEKLNH